LLSIQLERRRENDEVVESILQIWYMMNYHWYLKQEFVFQNICFEMVFDIEDPMILHLMFHDGSYKSYEFVWDTYSATSISMFNHRTVAVIDGGSYKNTISYYFFFPYPYFHRSIINHAF
jgi:elongator complex protein 1